MKIESEERKTAKLLNELNRAYNKIDKLTLENKRFKKAINVKTAYTASQILAAAKEGEVNHFDAEHIVKILERTINK